MMSRYKRMWMVAGIVAGVGLAAWLGTQAFRSNVMFFFDPTQIAAGEAPTDKRFRRGGMVEKGSVQKTPGTLDIHFLVTDFRHTVPVSYSGRTYAEGKKINWKDGVAAFWHIIRFSL